ncbi:MAG TPA: asparagine synthase (glutamine-hydrolyzing) [Elusimicrobiales bacterium]|nr:asparagine synthase (glutamine-hydrolyzing) [Elusimicrobiales bacterium]
MIFGIFNLARRADPSLIRRIINNTKESCPGGTFYAGRDIGLRSSGERSSFFEDRPLKTAIAYNGELYNYTELRRELEAAGCRFSSTLESELVLRAYALWGADCQNKFNGIWAFAVWDGRKNELFCSRDRFGRLPFYYFCDARHFAFGSRIKLLFSCPFISTAPNGGMVFDYLVLDQAEHSEETFYRDAVKLEAGCCLLVSPGKKPVKRRYYDPRCNLEIGDFDKKAFKKHAAEFRALLESSVKARLRPPFPIGCMLSGGLDSGAIGWLADKLVKKPAAGGDDSPVKVKTFCVTFVNEAKFIKAASGILTLPHYYISPGEIKTVSWKEIKAAVLSSEKPTIDTAFYREISIFGKAYEKGMRVLLSGMGADELLAGQETYFKVYLSQIIRSGDLRRFARELKLIYAGRLGDLGITGDIGPDYYKSFLRAQFNAPQLSDFRPEETINRGFLAKHESRRLRYAPRPELNLQKLLHKTLLELSTDFQSDSAWSREPFLDHRLVDYVLALPVCYKIHNGWTKYLLREAMTDVLPEIVCWRKRKYKVGLETWRDFMGRNSANIKAALSGRKFHSAPFVNQKAVLRNFDMLLANAVDPEAVDISALWRFVNLELWLAGNMLLERRRKALAR